MSIRAEAIDTSGKSLLEFWKKVGANGDMKPNTAAGLRAACSQILQVDPSWETLDVRTIDVDAFFRRFLNKRGMDFTQDSREAYRRRFAVAVRSFLEYARDPASWRPPVQERDVQRREIGPAREVDEALSIAPVMSSPERAAPPTGLVEYPYPLRQGRLTYLRLPADLTAAEVKRLTAFLETLVVDAEAK